MLGCCREAGRPEREARSEDEPAQANQGAARRGPESVAPAWLVVPIVEVGLVALDVDG
jgi:hypothetical protein